VFRTIFFWLTSQLGFKFCEGCGTFVDTRPKPGQIFDDGTQSPARVRHSEDVCFGVRRKDLARHRVAIDHAKSVAEAAKELVADHENDILSLAAGGRERDRQIAGLTREYSTLKEQVRRWVGVVYRPEVEERAAKALRTLVLNERTEGQQEFTLPLDTIRRLAEQGSVTVVVTPLGGTTVDQKASPPEEMDSRGFSPTNDRSELAGTAL
jgi:hypothetical protein